MLPDWTGDSRGTEKSSSAATAPGGPLGEVEASPRSLPALPRPAAAPGPPRVARTRRTTAGATVSRPRGSETLAEGSESRRPLTALALAARARTGLDACT